MLRLTTETQRPPETPGTHLLGGVAKIGSALEKFLRAVMEEVAIEARVNAADYMPTFNGRRQSTKRATMGQSISAIRTIGSAIPRPTGRVRAIVAELQRPSSILSQSLALRNTAAHEGDVLPDLRKIVEALRVLVQDHRREQGWT